jgi:iodotyrosine deiodinase
MTKAEFSSFTDYYEYPQEEMKKRSAEFYAEMKRRRTVRQFSDRPVPREIIEDCLHSAATAPSGANMQPWSFVVVTDPAVKRQIREEAEKTEREFYRKSATRKWVDDLKLLGTNEYKPFL